MDGSLDGADDMGQFDHRQATYRLPQAYTKVEGGPQVNAGLTSTSTWCLRRSGNSGDPLAYYIEAGFLMQLSMSTNRVHVAANGYQGVQCRRFLM